MKRISNEVYYLENKSASVSREDLSKLKEIALKNESNKARLCTHSTTEDIIHEMFIVHTKNLEIKPHKHRDSIESFHIIEGTILLTIYSCSGEVKEKVELSSTNPLSLLYYRIAEDTYHKIDIISDIAVFKETTMGPFNKDHSIFADWTS